MRALTTTQGISLAQYISFCISFIFAFSLAFGSYKLKPDVAMKQVATMLASWSLCGSVLVLVVIFREDYIWSSFDRAICVTSGSLIGAVYLWSVLTKKTAGDPAVRALVALALKSAPQFLLVPIIIAQGGSGYTVSAILLGHISILSRFIPIVSSWRSGSKDRNKKWLIIEGVFNFLSWSAVTIVWITH